MENTTLLLAAVVLLAYLVKVARGIHGELERAAKQKSPSTLFPLFDEEEIETVRQGVRALNRWMGIYGESQHEREQAVYLLQANRLPHLPHPASGEQHCERADLRLKGLFPNNPRRISCRFSAEAKSDWAQMADVVGRVINFGEITKRAIPNRRRRNRTLLS